MNGQSKTRNLRFKGRLLLLYRGDPEYVKGHPSGYTLSKKQGIPLSLLQGQKGAKEDFNIKIYVDKKETHFMPQFSNKAPDYFA